VRWELEWLTHIRNRESEPFTRSVTNGQNSAESCIDPAVLHYSDALLL
jgi:hypothetical protein